MEYSLLARAAGETNRSGEEAFEISYLSYQGATPLDSLTPSLRVHDKTRIGSYSALLREREFQDGFSNMSRLSQKNWLRSFTCYLLRGQKRRKASMRARFT